jgi:replicative DNA helicase
MTENEKIALLSQFGKNFQELLMTAFLTDKNFASQIQDVFKSEYFELQYLQFLSERYFTYSKKYKDFPSLQLLVTIIRDELKNDVDAALRNQTIDYLQRTKTSVNQADLPYVKERSLDFCKKQSLKDALFDVLGMIESEKYDAIQDRIKKALHGGQKNDLGMAFFEDYEARFVKEPRYPIVSGFKELDQKSVLNGGFGRGELIYVIAPSGVGKSHLLVQFGANAMRNGKNVLHFTFELSENVTGLRYDSNFTNINSNDIGDNKELVLGHYENGNYGNLQIKGYPSNSVSVNALKAYLEKLQLMKNFTPDLIIIDYADKLKSAKEYDSLRHELALVSEELRAWACELSCPILTASQSNRGSYDKSIITLDSIAESLAKIQIADIVLTLSRKEAEKFTGFGRLFIAKNRAGQDGQVYCVHLDTGTSTMKILEQDMDIESLKHQDENDNKTKVKDLWNKVKDEL